MHEDNKRLEALLKSLLNGQYAHLYLSKNEDVQEGYPTVASILKTFGAGLWFPSQEEKQKAIDTNSMWKLQWYPDSPVGNLTANFATLRSLIGYLQGSSFYHTGDLCAFSDEYIEKLEGFINGLISDSLDSVVISYNSMSSGYKTVNEWVSSTPCSEMPGWVSVDTFNIATIANSVWTIRYGSDRKSNYTYSAAADLPSLLEDSFKDKEVEKTPVTKPVYDLNQEYNQPVKRYVLFVVTNYYHPSGGWEDATHTSDGIEGLIEIGKKELPNPMTRVTIHDLHTNQTVYDRNHDDLDDVTVKPEKKEPEEPVIQEIVISRDELTDRILSKGPTYEMIDYLTKKDLGHYIGGQGESWTWHSRERFTECTYDELKYICAKLALG